MSSLALLNICHRCCRKGGTAKGAAYIKISEAEIADDYPEPAQYDKVQPHHTHLRVTPVLQRE